MDSSLVDPPNALGERIAAVLALDPVQMLTSGTTGPPKRIDRSYESLRRVLVGAEPRLAVAGRCRRTASSARGVRSRRGEA